MCRKPRYTRRWCTVCKEVTSWKIDRAINHSRCIRCHSLSTFSKKVKKDYKETPKVNKQYVQEQIKIAVNAMRKEYDEKFAAIYQCPDCGALALRTSEHVCLAGKVPVSSPEIVPAKPKRKTITDYVLSVLPCEPPADETIEENSPYLAKSIATRALDSGYPGSALAVAAQMSEMVKSNLVRRRATTIKVTSSRGNKKFEKEVPGFVYWRAAV